MILLKVYFGDPANLENATLTSVLNRVNIVGLDDNVFNGSFISPPGQGLSVAVIVQFGEAMSKPIFVNFERPEIYAIHYNGIPLTQGESITRNPPGIPTEGALVTISGENLGMLPLVRSPLEYCPDQISHDHPTLIIPKDFKYFLDVFLFVLRLFYYF